MQTNEPTSSITSSSILNTDEDFFYNEQVDVIEPKTGTVHNGHIVSIRGQLLIVKFDDQKEGQFKRDDRLVIKQWYPGREFQIYNRVDIQLTNSDYWTEGIVIDIKENKVFVRYANKNKEIKDEWLINDSERLAKVGTHSGRFDPCATSCDEINARLFSKRKIISMNGKQEQNFRVEINKVNLVIKEIQGDGNCLFRAISDQVYGDERYHDILRDKCMDYISIERKFFSQFVEGGEASFDEYIAMKRTSGVWGDDIELQALSEIYNRPIEIFLNSNKPLKTFHENYDGCSRNCNNVDYNNINNVKKFPIRVSYHGKAHYNSVIPSKTNYEYSLYVNAMLSSKPGEAEDAFILRIAKDKEKKEEDIAKARQRFKESQTNKNIDDLLFDTLTLSDKAANENVAKAMKESELEGYENELIDSVKKISLENTNEDIDYYSIPSIQTALEFGFSLDDAIIAYSLYGNKSDLMLQYLYSLNMNN